VELSHAGLEVCEKFGDFHVSRFPWITPHAIVPFSVKNDEAPGPICVSLLGVNAVVLKATDGPHLTSRFGLFRLTAPGKMPSMTDLDGATIKLKRIRPKQCVFKGAIIGPNPR
jgi:hypothetical protein